MPKQVKHLAASSGCEVKAISTNPLLATRIGDSESMKEEELQEKAFNAMHAKSLSYTSNEK